MARHRNVRGYNYDEDGEVRQEMEQSLKEPGHFGSQYYAHSFKIDHASSQQGQRVYSTEDMVTT